MSSKFKTKKMCNLKTKSNLKILWNSLNYLKMTAWHLKSSRDTYVTVLPILLLLDTINNVRKGHYKISY